jgi:predicted DNA-binding protein (MmcQ/YjbR family)
MTRRELINICLEYPDAYEDYPFDDVITDYAWTVMRHRGNKKAFAFICQRDGRVRANLKCDPFESDFLRQAFKDIIPAYHMNKTHWNTVVPDGDVPRELFLDLITKSYRLTNPKIKIKADDE